MPRTSRPRFGRNIPAMVTPFDANGAVDVERARELGHRLVDGGSDALLVLGTTGENPTVSHDDKLRLFRAMTEEFKGVVPVVANVGSNDTAASIDFAREAAACGVDGIMCVVPYYNKPPQAGLYRHFKAIADACPLPMVMYNIPGRCGVNMEAETTLALARDCENIVAVKEASGRFDQILSIIEGAPEGFAVYSGDDASTYQIMRLGGDGVITTTGNVAPAGMREITEKCAAGEWDAAWEAHTRLLPLMRALFATSNPILVKKALEIAGFPVGGVRLPLVDATPEQAADLRRVMREVGQI